MNAADRRDPDHALYLEGDEYPWGGNEKDDRWPWIRRGDVFVAQFFEDKARLGVVVRSDLWRVSDNVTICQLTRVRSI